MLEFVCFVLDGQTEHGHKRVWQRLGGFDSRQAAEAAAQRHGSLVSSRISPLYRAPLAVAYPQPSQAAARERQIAPRFAEVSI